MVNTGKDFRKDSIEIIGRGDPGGYISLNAHDYELYRRGAHTFLTLEKVCIYNIVICDQSRPLQCEYNIMTVVKF